MKWMSTDQRNEWHTMMDEALDDPSASTNTARAELLFEKLRDAEQAHRPWAQKIIRDCVIRGLARCLSQRNDARNRVLVALPRGRSVERKARRGVRVAAPDGRTVHQQKLIHDLTWDEVEALHADLSRQLGSLSDSRTMIAGLRKLKVQCPDSTGPGDAARRLDTTLEQFLAA